MLHVTPWLVDRARTTCRPPAGFTSSDATHNWPSRPNDALGKARAQFGAKRPSEAIATLDNLQSHWPNFQSAEAHLLYARALAEAGRADEALEEFSALLAYSPGAEVRVRYGMLLKLVGRTAEARVVFNELLLQMKRAPKHARDMQAEWLAIAEKQLSA